MRIWKLKDEFRNINDLHPQDFVCIEIGDKLLFVQESGTYDLASVDCGLPIDNMWEMIIGEDE